MKKIVEPTFLLDKKKQTSGTKSTSRVRGRGGETIRVLFRIIVQ